MLSINNTGQEEAVAPPPSALYMILGKYSNISAQVPYLETEKIDPHGVVDIRKLSLHAQDVENRTPVHEMEVWAGAVLMMDEG